jgi:DNA-binding MarR family transcriptional regulator
VARRDDLRDIDKAFIRVGRIGRGRAATRLRAQVSGVELTNAAAGILGALHQHGPLRATALAEAADTEAPLVSRELRTLTAQGYVTTKPDPTDGRGRVVSITRKGRVTYERFRDGADSITAHAFRDWSDRDVAMLRELLLRVVDDFSTTGRPD